MRKPWGVIGIVGTALFASACVAYAFTEPTTMPPLGNTPAPITVGSGRQVKTGDLTVNNLNAATITLGGETRSSWLDAASSCGWSGWRCDCQSDGSSAASVAITMGMQCSGGQLAGIKVVSLAISSKEKSCGKTAPAPCNQALYTYKNAAGSAADTFLGTTTKVIKCISSLGIFC